MSKLLEVAQGPRVMDGRSQKSIHASKGGLDMLEEILGLIWSFCICRSDDVLYVALFYDCLS